MSLTNKKQISIILSKLKHAQTKPRKCAFSLNNASLSFPGESFTVEYLMNTTIFPEARCVEKKSRATTHYTISWGKQKKKRNQEDEEIAKSDTHF